MLINFSSHIYLLCNSVSQVIFCTFKPLDSKPTNTGSRLLPRVYSLKDKQKKSSHLAEYNVDISKASVC